MALTDTAPQMSCCSSRRGFSPSSCRTNWGKFAAVDSILLSSATIQFLPAGSDAACAEGGRTYTSDGRYSVRCTAVAPPGAVTFRSSSPRAARKLNIPDPVIAGGEIPPMDAPCSVICTSEEDCKVLLDATTASAVDIDGEAAWAEGVTTALRATANAASGALAARKR